MGCYQEQKYKSGGQLCRQRPPVLASEDLAAFSATAASSSTNTNPLVEEIKKAKS